MAIARRPVRLVVSSVVMLILLAGCASDRAYDQQRAQETARTTDQAVIDIQASFTANRYASPTTTATPTPQPPAILYEIGLATGISGENQPSTLVTAVANNVGRVYVTANLDGLSEGATVGIGWYVNTLKPEDFVFVGESTITVTGGGRQWIAVPYDLNGALEPKDYAVYLYVDGEVIGSLGIEILPAGSQPRSV